MKKILFVLCLTFILTGASEFVYGQKNKPFNGSITYSISYPDSKLDPVILASQPTEIKVVVLGNKSKSEMVIEGMLFITQISNGDSRTTITMIDVSGEKIYYKLTEEEMNARKTIEDEPQTELLEESKEIIGYTCKKAIITMKDEYGDSYQTTVYYAPDIVGKEFNFNGGMKDIPGLPLYYELKQGEQLLVFEAKEIKKGKFKDKDFMIPADYRELSPEEKQKIIDAFESQ